MVREHRNLNVKEWRANLRAKQVLVSLVTRMSHERHTRGQQLRPGGVNLNVLRFAVEHQAMVSTGLLAIFEFGLGNRRPEGHVPERWGEILVRLTALNVSEKGKLGCAKRLAPNRAVRLRPIDRKPERSPESFELLLVFDGEPLAQFNEVAARNRELVGRPAALGVAALKRGNELRVVRQRRVAAHAVVVLNAALGGQTVVVPSHRVEHALTAHALESGHHVGVGVREHVPDMQRARGGRRRSIN